jgi:hypothetical protein
MDLTLRLGTFFLLVGTGSMALFVLSVLANETNVLYLLFAILGISLGILFRRKKEPGAHNRFESLRRISEQNRKRRDDREKNRKK